MQTLSIKLENKLSELENIQASLQELTGSWGLSTHLNMMINLVLEEAFTNIVNYAFSDNGSHDIMIDLSLEGSELVIIITDDGQPYDPTLHIEPDLSLSAQQRPVGGLGIFLIRKIMDKVDYHRHKGKNKLTLTKIIDK